MSTEMAKDAVVFHATSRIAMPSIQRNGLPGKAPWGNAELAAYHARLLEDAGHVPIILSLPISDLQDLSPIPDWDALENPPLETVNRDVDALVMAWGKTDADWKASLDLLGSFCLSENVPARLLRQRCPSIDRWAEEARKSNIPRKRGSRKRRAKAQRKQARDR